MADYNFKDAVCIDAPVIYDSCADRDCLEDLLVYFSTSDQILVNNAKSARLRNADVDFVCVDIEPIAYQKGFYSIDITFVFKVWIDLCVSSTIKTVCGECFFTKKVVLCGSEGNVKVFTSEQNIDECETEALESTNLPKATVQVADPVGLDAKLCCGKKCHEPCCFELPECLCGKYNFITQSEGKDKCDIKKDKCVLVTLGIFSIVQLQRNVQLLIPACNFCVPTKECDSTTDTPCDLFSKIDFPINEFFPKQCESSCDCCDE